MKRSAFGVAALFCCLAAPASDVAQRPRTYVLTSVRFRVSHLQGAREFYQNTFLIGAVRQNCLGNQTLCLGINRAQELQLVQRDASSISNSVEQVGFRTYDLAGLRRYLVQRGLKPEVITKDKDGTPSFAVLDPEGHRIVFFPPPRPGSYASWAGRIGTEIIHAGFVVHHRAAKDILGFHLYWHGGMRNDQTDWVDMQVPDGPDWIEYLLNISPNADKHTSA